MLFCYLLIIINFIIEFYSWRKKNYAQIPIKRKKKCETECMLVF